MSDNPTEDISIFTNKSLPPDEKELAEKLAPTYPLWTAIRDGVLERWPQSRTEWSYPGKKFGWSFRIKDKKRAIIYLLPREGFFKAAFVFGENATHQILESDVQEEIKEQLRQALPYAEGRGIRITIRKNADIQVIKFLLEIKMNN